MIRFGTHPIAWLDDLLDGTAEAAAVEACLREAAEAGFDGIEMSPSFPQDPDSLAKVMSAAGLSLAAVSHRAALRERDAAAEFAAMEDTLAQARACGTGIVALHEGTGAIHDQPTTGLSKRPELSADDWPTFATRVDGLAQMVADAGMTLVYQPLLGTVVQTPEDIDRLVLETGDATRLLFDSGQIYFGGGDPAQVLTRHLPRVAHVHISAIRVKVMTRARMDDMSYLSAQAAGIFTVPGDRDGSMDVDTLMNLLQASGYDGWVVLAVGRAAGQAPLEDQARGLGALRASAGKAGLA